MAGIGVVLGLIGGVAAYLVVRLVGLISNLALLHRVGFTLPNLRYYHPTPVLIPVAIGGAVVVSAEWWADLLGHYGLFDSEGRKSDPFLHADQR